MTATQTINELNNRYQKHLTVIRAQARNMNMKQAAQFIKEMEADHLMEAVDIMARRLAIREMKAEGLM